MQMDSDGTKVWKTLTEKNIGRPIAVTLDDNVYTAPNVNTAIPNGQSVIR
jgi:SecD/SecF fusion protein